MPKKKVYEPMERNILNEFGAWLSIQSKQTDDLEKQLNDGKTVRYLAGDCSYYIRKEKHGGATADAADSKSVGGNPAVGSNPTRATR